MSSWTHTTLFSFLSLGRRYRSLKMVTFTFRNSFFPISSRLWMPIHYELKLNWTKLPGLQFFLFLHTWVFYHHSFFSVSLYMLPIQYCCAAASKNFILFWFRTLLQTAWSSFTGISGTSVLNVNLNFQLMILDPSELNHKFNKIRR